MSATTALLDRWKAAQGITSDNAAAERLNVTRGALSNWRTGVSHADAALIMAMCDTLRISPTPEILKVAADREKRPTIQRRLLDLAAKAGKAAAALLLGFTFADRAQCHIVANATFDINAPEYTYAPFKQRERVAALPPALVP